MNYARACLLATVLALPAPAAMAQVAPAILRRDVSFAVEDYARAVREGSASLAKLREWPAQRFPGVDLSVEVRQPRGRRLPYDIVAVVGSRDGCEAAVNAAYEDSQEITIGRLLLSPYELQPVTNGKSRLFPSATHCQYQFYPLTLRFGRDVMLRLEDLPREPER